MKKLLLLLMLIALVIAGGWFWQNYQNNRSHRLDPMRAALGNTWRENLLCDRGGKYACLFVGVTDGKLVSDISITGKNNRMLAKGFGVRVYYLDFRGKLVSVLRPMLFDLLDGSWFF